MLASQAAANRLRTWPFRLWIEQHGALLVILPAGSRPPTDLVSLQVKPQPGLPATLAAASRLLVRGLCPQTEQLRAPSMYAAPAVCECA